MEKKAFKRQGRDVLIRVKVKANSDQFEVGEINKWRGRLRINVAAVAKKGKANQELIDNLEERLERKVKIKSGHKTNKKLLRVKNSTSKEVRDRLLA